MPRLLHALCITVLTLSVTLVHADKDDHHGKKSDRDKTPIGHAQLGPRPFYVVEDMDTIPLKHKLQRCANGSFKRSNFSICHRGGALQFPEHTRESHISTIGQNLPLVVKL